jgi:hypothetical protein
LSDEERIVRHLPCEFCTGSDPASCVVCGGAGYVELITRRKVNGRDQDRQGRQVGVDQPQDQPEG